ncbi:MAG: undecaprenyl-diphosphatase [Psychrilyobacter sp.]|nr:undecaprenyl-diphosphatase [Psychrilyobacter sp.]
MGDLNNQLFLLINNFAGKNETFDKVGVFLGENGPFIFIGLILYLYFIRKNKKETIYATFTVILAILFNHVLELFYFHPRPFAVGLGTVLKEHAADSSFPSDHTTFMLALSWSLIAFVKTKKVGINMIIVGTIFGLFRVFEGVHYPFDILGALAMGWVSAFIIYKSQNILNPLVTLILKIDSKIFKTKIKN